MIDNDDKDSNDYVVVLVFSICMHACVPKKTLFVG